MISGQKVRGTIKGFVDGGLEVKVGATLVGFIPTLFLSDVRLQHPEKKFFIGNKQELRNPAEWIFNFYFQELFYL